MCQRIDDTATEPAPGMKCLTEAMRADDNAQALTIARQLVYLASYSDGPIAERHDDLVCLLAHVAERGQ